MSDQALVWKAAFGSLVLVFSVASYVLRHSEQEQVPPVAARVAAPDAELSAAPEKMPAPDDTQEDAQPARVQVTLHDAAPEPTMAVPRAQVRAKLRSQLPAKPRPLIHKVVHATRSRPVSLHPIVFNRSRSPYAIGRMHYPYDPRDRRAMRDAP